MTWHVTKKELGMACPEECSHVTKKSVSTRVQKSARMLRKKSLAWRVQKSARMLRKKSLAWRVQKSARMLRKRACRRVSRRMTVRCACKIKQCCNGHLGAFLIHSFTGRCHCQARAGESSCGELSKKYPHSLLRALAPATLKAQHGRDAQTRSRLVVRPEGRRLRRFLCPSSGACAGGRLRPDWSHQSWAPGPAIFGRRNASSRAKRRRLRMQQA